MSEIAFQGSVGLVLDGKGRVTVPLRHRLAFPKDAPTELTMCKHPSGCLLMFPRQHWDPFLAQLLTLKLKAEAWRRFFIGSAVELEMDGAQRVLVPPELRGWAALNDNVMMVGVGSHLELWDKGRFDVNEAQTLAAGMPEELQEMVL